MDLNCMTNEELNELISQIKEVKENRAESRKADLWNNVRRAVNNYIAECGMIEIFTEDRNFMADALAQQRIQQIKENQQAKYMGAIRKAFEDYFENVGPIEVTFGYEDAYGAEGAATVEVNSDNPPCFCQQSIEFP